MISRIKSSFDTVNSRVTALKIKAMCIEEKPETCSSNGEETSSERKVKESQLQCWSQRWFRSSRRTVTLCTTETSRVVVLRVPP